MGREVRTTTQSHEGTQTPTISTDLRVVGNQGSGTADCYIHVEFNWGGEGRMV